MRKVDSDLWIRDVGDHWKYIKKYINNILIISKDSKAILEQMKKSNGPYDFKGVRNCKCYLGGDIKITYRGNFISEISLSSKACIERLCKKVE